MLWYSVAEKYANKYFRRQGPESRVAENVDQVLDSNLLEGERSG